MNKDLPDIERLRLPGNRTEQVLSESSKRPPRQIRGGKFLRGPVPWDWLCEAMDAGCSAFIVGIFIWFRAGVEKALTVRVCPQHVPKVNRYRVYRGLNQLQDAGLITMDRRHGRCPVVTLRKVENDREN